MLSVPSEAGPSAGLLALTATCTGAEGHAEDEAHVAFGGERNSGLGRFNGDWAIDEFTTDHTIGVPRL